MVEYIVGAIVLLIAIGLLLRYGNSSIGLFKAASSGVYQETALLTLANSGNVQYPYQGPTSGG